MANQTARIGVAHCEEIAARNGWIFREQPIEDIGIDAHMEYVEETGKTRQLLALQIKTGESWFSEKKDNCYVFRDINERQYNYWVSNSLPCILVLYNPVDDTCIWQKLKKETINRTKNGEGKGYYVEVPISQVFLNSQSIKDLLSFSNLPEHVTNYNFLLSQKRFMQIIQDGGMVKLHSEEWVNKSSGRGKIEIIVDDGKDEHTFLYPYWFPYTPYTMVFSKLFPWADFTADEEFYYDEDLTLWHELHCYYDKEDDDWLIVGDSFEEFRNRLDPMRSINNSGEVAEYMLDLRLNDLGRAFLAVDNFISKDRPYTVARPVEND